jgi:hypothetical protein
VEVWCEDTVEECCVLRVLCANSLVCVDINRRVCYYSLSCFVQLLRNCNTGIAIDYVLIISSTIVCIDKLTLILFNVNRQL